MPALTWLADVLRGAGLTVHEVSGWRTRSNRSPASSMAPVGILCHATAGSRTASDAAEIGVLLHGSKTAPPPIAHLYVNRAGHWWVIAAGVCNHAGRGGLWGVTSNRHVIGIEAANDNRTEAWPAVQYHSYARGVAAICAHMGWDTSRVAAHKEWAPGRKTDPTFGMPAFRTHVAHYMEEQMSLTESRWQWLAGRVHGTYQMLATGVDGSALTRWQQHTTNTLTGIADQLAGLADADTMDPAELRTVAAQARTAAEQLAALPARLDLDVPTHNAPDPAPDTEVPVPPEPPAPPAPSYRTGFIRVTVPAVVGGGLTWLASRCGVVLAPDSSAELVSGTTALTIAAYYGIARALEERWPKLGVLLGARRTPASGPR